MNLASPLSIAIVAITALALIGLPMGHAMIAGSILFLLLDGQDMATAAEQILNGLYTSYILLAVPLFIFAAELMNVGSMTERLLGFCNALVGRFRGGSRRSTSCRASSSPACPARRSPTPPARAA
jgi:C4-dicarboxylate transporter DctM subunit